MRCFAASAVAAGLLPNLGISIKVRRLISRLVGQYYFMTPGDRRQASIRLRNRRPMTTLVLGIVVEASSKQYSTFITIILYLRLHPRKLTRQRNCHRNHRIDHFGAGNGSGMYFLTGRARIGEHSHETTPLPSSFRPSTAVALAVAEVCSKASNLIQQNLKARKTQLLPGRLIASSGPVGSSVKALFCCYAIQVCRVGTSIKRTLSWSGVCWLELSNRPTPSPYHELRSDPRESIRSA